MSQQKSAQGLSIDDIYKLIHNPEQFILTLENMSQTYILLQNLNDYFKLPNKKTFY